MNINFRKSLRRSSRSSTFYLESFEMYDRIKHISLEDLNSSKYTTSSTSLPVIDFRIDENVINRVKPIGSVFKYDLNSDRSKGTVGQIVLTNLRMIFVPYSHDGGQQANGRPPTDYRAESDLNGDLPFDFPPFELVAGDSSKSNEDVEYLDIYDLICKEKLLQIYCSDFRCLEFGLRSSALVKHLADHLERLIVKPLGSVSPMGQLSQNLSPSMSSLNSSALNQMNHIATSRCYELTYFWAMIGSQYPFNYPKDWEAHEGYWYSSNSLLRISQANENYQLCKSLPASFITLKYYLTDVNLLQNISAKMKGQRVPVITYSYKCRPKHVDKTQITNRFNHHYQELQLDHMLIRSGIINKADTYLLIQAISPLNIIEVSDHLPDQATFVSTYLKLREACFLHSNSTHFLSQIGKWMKLVCKVLTVVNDLSKVLSEQSSLLLMEHNDNHWNVLLSCLIQIQLDKRRRTIEGFNSLLSKEWLYLVSGLRNTSRLEHSKLPNQILFTMFLDCVYQMLHQNPTSFEFTSLYLIRCFDLSFKPYSAFLKLTRTADTPAEPSRAPPSLFRTPIKPSASLRQRATFHHKSSPIHFSKLTSPNNHLSLYHNHHSPNAALSPILKNLSFAQTMFYYSPFYEKAQPDLKLDVCAGILSVQFWRPLYLRWSKPFRSLDYYNQFSTKEYLYFRALVEQNAGLRRVVQLEASDSSSRKSSDRSSRSTDPSLNGAQSTDNDLEDSFEHF